MPALLVGPSKKGEKVRALALGKTLKAGKKKEDEQEELSKKVKEAQQYVDRHSVGRVLLEMDQIVSPRTDLAARGLDEAWVKKLVESFKRTDTVSEISVVLRDSVIAKKVELDGVEECVEDLKEKKYEVFAGAALRRCNPTPLRGDERRAMGEDDL